MLNATFPRARPPLQMAGAGGHIHTHILDIHTDTGDVTEGFWPKFGTIVHMQHAKTDHDMACHVLLRDVACSFFSLKDFYRFWRSLATPNFGLLHRPDFRAEMGTLKMHNAGKMCKEVRF